MMINKKDLIFNKIYNEISYKIINTTFKWFLISLLFGIFIKGLFNGFLYSLFFITMILIAKYDIYSFHILRRFKKDSIRRRIFIEEIAEHINIKDTEYLENIPLYILVDTSNSVMRLYYR
jgi:hypothetical protein